MKRKILILGKGFLALRLQEALGCDISGRRIHCFRDIEKDLKKYKPDIIINCIGHIGRNVDDCELDKDKTLLANTFVPVILAEAALRNRIKLVHISSGCIYHYDYAKDMPIREDRVPDFFELFYSRSKIYSERALEILCDKFNFLILRPRVFLDNRSHPRNLIDKLISFKKIIDIPNSVTYIPDFINALRHLLKIDARGVYNVVNKGGLRYPMLLEVYKKYLPGFRYEVLRHGKLKLVRTNLILSTRKLENTGFKVRHIKEVLEECIYSYLKGA
jgi:3,5-epimerase/4-reductase